MACPPCHPLLGPHCGGARPASNVNGLAIPREGGGRGRVGAAPSPPARGGASGEPRRWHPPRPPPPPPPPPSGGGASARGGAPRGVQRRRALPNPRGSPAVARRRRRRPRRAGRRARRRRRPRPGVATITAGRRRGAPPRCHPAVLFGAGLWAGSASPPRPRPPPSAAYASRPGVDGVGGTGVGAGGWRRCFFWSPCRPQRRRSVAGRH